ncbi:MAG TPA: hypothetical protein ENG01_01375, partial [Candidatus Aenigmarchaeota archaeon]|nr:hypothetical protein [Candidatus Aenigmarchaeota archaeon]HEX33048.1 hypothetical protein [Candidatus Aenigmarchaeota archaeon]
MESDIMNAIDGDYTFLYHTDTCGVISMSLIERAIGKVKKFPINYDYNMHKLKDGVVLVDFEPASEILNRIDGDIVVIGHHPKQEYKKEITYINTHDYYSELVRIYDLERYPPIIYPLMKMKKDKVSERIGILGLVSYGFIGLARILNQNLEGQDVEGSLTTYEKIATELHLVSAYKWKNLNNVVDTLTNAESWEDVKALRKFHSRKMDIDYSKTIHEAIQSHMVLGRVNYFRIPNYFDGIQPFKWELRNLVKRFYRPEVIIFAQVKNSTTKVSIISEHIDLVSLLKRAIEPLGIDNFGGHEKSAGIIAPTELMLQVVAAIVKDVNGKEWDKSLEDVLAKKEN